MNIPDVGTSHLYKYLTVLGTFILCSSIYSTAVILNRQETQVLETLFRVSESQSLEPEERKVVFDSLLLMKKNAEWGISGAIVSASIGLTIAIIGAGLWYRKVQRHEDDKQALEVEALKHQNEEAKAQKKLFM